MAFTFGAKSEIHISTATGISLGLTTPADTRVLVVGIATKTTTQRTGGAPTFNSVPMTQVGATQVGSAECTCELWYLINPDIGGYNVSVPNTGAAITTVLASCYVDASVTSAALDVSNQTNVTVLNPSLVVTTGFAGEVIVDMLGSGGAAVETGRTQTLLYRADEGVWNTAAQYALQASAGAITFGHTQVSDDVAFVVAAFKGSAGLTAIGDTVQEIWNVRQAVPDTSQLIYHVRAAVGDTVQHIWNVRSAIGDIIQSIWHTRQAVGQAKQALWNIRIAVSDTTQLVWNVLASVTAVGDTFQLIWNVKQAIGDAVQPLWNVRAVIADTIQTIWNIKKTLSDTIQSVWNILIPASDSMQTIWNVRQAVNKTRQLIWNVLENLTEVGDAFQLLWVIRIRQLKILTNVTVSQELNIKSSLTRGLGIKGKQEKHLTLIGEIK